MLGFFYLWSCKDIFFFKYSGILKRLSYFCSIFCEEKNKICCRYFICILYVLCDVLFDNDIFVLDLYDVIYIMLKEKKKFVKLFFF